MLSRAVPLSSSPGFPSRSEMVRALFYAFDAASPGIASSEQPVSSSALQVFRRPFMLGAVSVPLLFRLDAMLSV